MPLVDVLTAKAGGFSCILVEIDADKRKAEPTFRMVKDFSYLIRPSSVLFL